MTDIDLDLAIAPDGSIIALVLKKPEGDRITFDEFILQLEEYLSDAAQARSEQLSGAFNVQ